MLKSIAVSTIVFGTIAFGDYCNPQLDRAHNPEWTGIRVESATQRIAAGIFAERDNELYVFPDYAQNLVLRIKDFGINLCNDAKVTIVQQGAAPNTATVSGITIGKIDFDEILITVNPTQAQFGALSGNFVVRITRDSGNPVEKPITFVQPLAHLNTDRNLLVANGITAGAFADCSMWSMNNKHEWVGPQPIALGAPIITDPANTQHHVRCTAGGDAWIQYVEPTLIPFRWTKSEGYYQNPEGGDEKFDHYPWTREMERPQLKFMAGHWHVIEYQMAGLPIANLEKIEAKTFLTKGKDAPGVQDCKSGIVMGTMTCGADDDDKFAKKCRGKLSGKFLGKTVNGGHIELEASFKDKDGKTKDRKTIVEFRMVPKGDTEHANIVYLTQRPLGSDKLKDELEWPLLTTTNAYRFGTNKAFAETKNVHNIMTISGTMPAYQIQCTGGCALHKDWKLSTALQNGKQQDCKDRKAKSMKKFAADCENGGFYVLETVAEKTEKDAGKTKDQLPVKTAMVIATPKVAQGQIRFMLRAAGVAPARKPLVEIRVNITEWDGALKFWSGLIALVVIIVLQVLSCVYMAKRNKANAVNAERVVEEEKN